MKEEPVTDALLRQFLLGKVDDEERERIESLFITDRLSRDRVLAAEQDLIEDYLEDCLTAADKEKFLLQYADTPTQQRKLRIAKSVQEWVARESNATRTADATISVWSRLRARMRLKPVFVIPIAVTSLIAIMAVAVWVNRRTEQKNTQHFAIEQELARLNDPANLREVPPQMLSLNVTPVSLRSSDRQNEITTLADVQVVELRLPWIQKEHYSSYRAVVRRIRDNESFTIPDLHAENNGGSIRLRLPPNILTRGLYQIRLTGVTRDVAEGLVEEYTFTVAGQ